MGRKAKEDTPRPQHPDKQLPPAAVDDGAGRERYSGPHADQYQDQHKKSGAGTAGNQIPDAGREPDTERIQIMEEDIELAKDLIRKLAIENKESDNPLLRRMSFVMTEDVVSILGMIQKGKFKAWYETNKKAGHKAFQ